MVNFMPSTFKTYERNCELYLATLPDFRKELLIEKINPTTTMQIYFSSVRLADNMKLFFELRNNFIDMYTFKDIFSDNNFLPVNDLWTFVEYINKEKENYFNLISGNFLKSKTGTLRLWEVDYENILNIYENYLNILLDELKGIDNSWFNFYKHLENDNKVFLDKDRMEIYKLISIPDVETPYFKLKRVQFWAYNKPYISDITLYPDDINLVHEIFLEQRLGESYPEYFI